MRILMKKVEVQSALSALIAPLSILMIAGCAVQAAPDPAPSEGTGSGGETPNAEIATESEALSLGNTVFSLEHHIQVSNDVNLHVLEKFTLKSLLRPNRRALLMATGTLVTNQQ